MRAPSATLPTNISSLGVSYYKNAHSRSSSETMSSPESSVGGNVAEGDARATTAAAATNGAGPTTSPVTAPSAKKKRGRPPKRQKTEDGTQDDSLEGQQMQSMDEIAASSYAPHMGIFLGHRVVKRFPQDRENYLGTVVAYHVPWEPALESSASDSDDDKKKSKSRGASAAAVSKEDSYNDFIASSFRLWKGDDVGVNGHAAQSPGSGNGIVRREKRKRKSATTGSVESRSIEACRQERRFGAIPGLYRVLFDDGDVEDVDPTDVYKYALKYHKMVSRSYPMVFPTIFHYICKHSLRCSDDVLLLPGSSLPQHVMAQSVHSLLLIIA